MQSQHKESIVIEKRSSGAQEESRAKGAAVREFYLCFCSKKYNSYSALYLHVKKTHGHSLNMKCLRVKHHRWSGSIKNVFYEFHESPSTASQHFQEKGTRKKMERNFKENLYFERQSRLWPLCDKSKCESRSEGSPGPIIDEQLDKAVTIFKSYLLECKDHPHSEVRQNVLQELQDYLKHNVSIWEPHHLNEVKGQSKICEAIPHILNRFYTDRGPQSRLMEQDVIRELGNFSLWLYVNKYASSLAIDSRIFQKMHANS